MKRKLFTSLVVIAAFSLTACQEDATVQEMDQLIQDTEYNSQIDGGTGGGNNDGSSGGGSDTPGSGG